MKDEVKAYIDKQKSPQKEILEKVRNIFMKTLPSCEAKKAWGVVTFAEKKFYIAAMIDHVNVGFAITGLSQDETELFRGQGKTMRHIEIYSLEEIDPKKLAKLIKLVNKKAVCVPC